jgi:hypothetical protein
VSSSLSPHHPSPFCLFTLREGAVLPGTSDTKKYLVYQNAWVVYQPSTERDMTPEDLMPYFTRLRNAMKLLHLQEEQQRRQQQQQKVKKKKAMEPAQPIAVYSNAFETCIMGPKGQLETADGDPKGKRIMFTISPDYTCDDVFLKQEREEKKRRMSRENKSFALSSNQSSVTVVCVFVFVCFVFLLLIYLILI